MPRWDLKCLDCGTVYDESFDSADERDWWLAHGHCCMFCKDKPHFGRLEVLPSNTSFELKGAGWPGKEGKK